MSGRAAAAVCCAFLLTAPVAATAPSRSAPDCPLHINGRDSSLKQLSGKVVYVDFWASWCVSCVASFPFMERMRRELGPLGLEIVGVNMDQKPADAARFLARHAVSFRIASGANDACAKRFGVNAMPSTYIVDRRGNIRAVHSGFRPDEGAGLRGLVEKILTEPMNP